MTLEGLIARRTALVENVKDSAYIYCSVLKELADKIDKEGNCVLNSEYRKLEQSMLNARKDYMEACEALNAINNKDFGV